MPKKTAHVHLIQYPLTPDACPWGGLLTRQPRPILEAGLLAGGGMGDDHAQT